MSLFKRLSIAAVPALAAAALCGACHAQAPAAAAIPAGPPPAAADWRQLNPENLLVIDTSKGRVIVEMRPELAAESVAQVKTLARRGFYDGLQFFRVIDDFMAQTGDSANTGAGPSPMPELKGTFSFRRGPDTPFAPGGKGVGGTDFGYVGPVPVYTQPDALSIMTVDGKVKAWADFCPGVAGMARTQNPDSASSQFFLMRGHAAFLNDQYTPWGRVVVGQDVVNALKTGEPPAEPDVMTKVRVGADMPANERPNLWRVDPASPSFQAQLAAVRTAKGASFGPCDVQPAVQAR